MARTIDRMRDSGDEFDTVDTMHETDGLPRVDGDAPPAPPTTMSTLPPPPTQSEVDLKRHRLVTMVGGLALIAGIVVGLGAFAAFNSLSDSSDDSGSDSGTAAVAASADAPETTAGAAETAATADTTVAIVPIDATAAADLEDDLSALEEDLSAAEEDLLATEAELEEVLADNELLLSQLDEPESDSSAAGMTAALATIDDLTIENQELAAQIDALTAQVAAGGAADPSDPDAPAPNANVGPDVAGSPEFSKYVGEALGSLSGRNVLGATQTECLGAAVVGDIGLEALGAALNRDSTNAQTAVLVESMERNAPGCAIDLTALF